MTEDFTRYANDPVGFVTDVLGDAGTPYSKQAEMLEALVDHRRVSVVGANGSGKDWAAARAVLWWLETRPESKALTLGPTQRQVEEIVWQEMREAYASVAEGRLSGRMLKSAYRIDEQRFALGFSTDNALNIQGFHSDQLLVVVTEAHAMPQAHMDAIKRLQPDRLLLVGNALSRDGEFYESHHGKRGLYHGIKISAFDTPNFTGEGGGRPGMVTPEYVEEYALDYGEDHPLYAASVLAEFPDSLDDSLVGREAVESAMERWEASAVVPAEDDCHSERSAAESRNPSGADAAGEERSPRDVSTALQASPSAPLNMTNGEPVYIGVDVARYGFDKSAVCVRQGERVLSMRSFERMDTMRLAYEVRRTARKTGARAVFVDEGGVGGGVVDRLRELGAGLRRPLRRRGAAAQALLQPALGDLLGAADAAGAPADRHPARRGAGRAVARPALRRVELGAGAAGGQAGDAQARHAVAGQGRRPRARVPRPAVAPDLVRRRAHPPRPAAEAARPRHRLRPPPAVRGR